MPQFILICRDKPDSLALRKETRPAHLEYVKEKADSLLLAGPMLNDHDEPVGSVLIIEADDNEDAGRFAQNDPYAKAGLFGDIEIRPFKIVRESLSG